jgi:hypothetical protein
MLLCALNPDNPYGYYVVLRWVCCGVFAYLASQASVLKLQGWVWVLGVTAAVYNPIFPFHLTREIWSVINVVTIGIAFVSIFAIKLIDGEDDFAQSRRAMRSNISDAAYTTSKIPTTMSPEELGGGLAIVCLKFLELHEQEQGNGVSELSGRAWDPGKQQMFHRELSALTFVSFRMAIELLGPVDKAKRCRIFSTFDQTTRDALDPRFLELTNHRGPCYSKCIRENWGSEYLGSSLSTLFDQFCLGSGNAEDEPLIVGDFFESFPGRASAVAAVVTVFDMCKAMFNRTQLACR